MTGAVKTYLPTFSLAALFWFASAVTIGFAVSQQSGDVDESGRLALFDFDRVFYGPTLLAIAAVLIIYELVRQSTLIGPPQVDCAASRFAHRFTRSVRWLLAVVLAVLLLMTQLRNREIIKFDDDSEFVSLYGELWPATLLSLALLLAMRLIVARRRTTAERGWKQWLSLAIVTVGILTIGFYVVTDRLLITRLVHIATCAVEKSHALRWHRPGVFPDHLAESFRSFWKAYAALSWVIAGGGAVVLTVLVHSKAALVGLGLLFAFGVVNAVGYAQWFATVEFPRLSPDLASEGFPARWPDYVAGGLILLGTAIALGYQLAVIRSQLRGGSQSSGAVLPRPSGLMAVAAVLVAVGSGSDSAIVAYEAVFDSSLWVISDVAWQDVLAKLVSYFALPETMIPLALAITGIGVVWQYYVPPADPQPVAPVRSAHFCMYTIAAAVFLVAAVPVFAAFGFCYYLGPWVL